MERQRETNGENKRNFLGVLYMISQKYESNLPPFLRLAPLGFVAGLCL